VGKDTSSTAIFDSTEKLRTRLPAINLPFSITDKCWKMIKQSTVAQDLNTFLLSSS
jgi:hypothetical protein